MESINFLRRRIIFFLSPFIVLMLLTAIDLFVGVIKTGEMSESYIGGALFVYTVVFSLSLILLLFRFILLPLVRAVFAFFGTKKTGRSLLNVLLAVACLRTP